MDKKLRSRIRKLKKYIGQVFILDGIAGNEE